LRTGLTRYAAAPRRDRGAQHAAGLLRQEIVRTMQLLGVRKIADTTVIPMSAAAVAWVVLTIVG
jgi:isopentenyl diphosphate isomerase/L-lactate dehydrogenase-like FMN-dependent dehydrogenase